MPECEGRAERGCTAGRASAKFAHVPEFFSDNTNTFVKPLGCSRTRVHARWRRLAAVGRLACLSCKLKTAHGLSGSVRSPHPPFGAVPEPAAEILQHLACGHDGVGARFI